MSGIDLACGCSFDTGGTTRRCSNALTCDDPDRKAAESILVMARGRARLREAAYLPIDYPAAQQEFRAQKAALTRAIHSGKKERVLLACRDAVREWNQPTRAWPDSWPTWQCALRDAYGADAPRLEDLA